MTLMVWTISSTIYVERVVSSLKERLNLYHTMRCNHIVLRLEGAVGKMNTDYDTRILSEGSLLATADAFGDLWTLQ